MRKVIIHSQSTHYFQNIQDQERVSAAMELMQAPVFLLWPPIQGIKYKLHSTLSFSTTCI